MKRKRTAPPHRINLTNLKSDTLDAIATHAGIMAEVTKYMTEDQLMPYFREECLRLEEIACDELMRRGVIVNFEAEEGYAEADTEPMSAVRMDDEANASV